MRTDSFWKKALFWVAFSLGIGGAATFITRKKISAFDLLRKPPLTPPRIVFPIAWSFLLVLIGLGIAYARREAFDKDTRERVTVAYGIQMVFFFCWMLWFFGLGWYGFAALWLIGMIAAIVNMIRTYKPVSRLAAALQLPYAVWCGFALYLNIGIWALNRR